MHVVKPTFLKVFVAIALYMPCLIGVFFVYYVFILYSMPPYPDIVLLLFVTAIVLVPVAYGIASWVVITHKKLFYRFFTITIQKTLLAPLLIISMVLFVNAIPISWDCGYPVGSSSSQTVSHTNQVRGVSGRVFSLRIRTLSIQDDFAYALSTCSSPSFFVWSMRFFFGFSSVLFSYFISSIFVTIFLPKKKQ